jgi:hypothetical protein
MDKGRGGRDITMRSNSVWNGRQKTKDGCWLAMRGVEKNEGLEVLQNSGDRCWS